MTEHWFIPDTPDVVGMLRKELAATTDGIDALKRWSDGDEAAAALVGDAQHRTEATRRELLETLRDAFVVPVEPEDSFALSRGIGRIVEYANDLVNESKAMACPPDAVISRIAAALGKAIHQLDVAASGLKTDTEAAIHAADSAVELVRQGERAYYDGMVQLLEERDQRVRIARRELYRRADRIGEAVVDVAERIVYAIVKQT